MGPIRVPNPSHRPTSAWWKSTALAVLLAGCQGPRPSAPTPTAEPVVPPTAETTPHAAEAVDRVRSVAEADGATRLVLPPRPDLHPGDALHIRNGERLVATALVVSADAQQTLARVVAITDQRRPVRPGDAFGPVPADTPPAPAVAPAAAVPEHPPAAAEGAAQTMPANEPAPAVEHVPAAEHGPAAEPAAVAHQPSPEAAAAVDPHAASVHAPAAEATGAIAVAAEHAPAAEPAPATAAHEPAAVQAAPSAAMEPEIRARLEAERAYWELAARVLRLPAGGPELAALQERLRREVTAQGTAP